jgi:hypothetical protein
MRSTCRHSCFAIEEAKFARKRDGDVTLARETEGSFRVVLALAAPGLKRPSHLKASFIVSCTRMFGRCSMRVTFATDSVHRLEPRTLKSARITYLLRLACHVCDRSDLLDDDRQRYRNGAAQSGSLSDCLFADTARSYVRPLAFPTAAVRLRPFRDHAVGGP